MTEKDTAQATDNMRIWDEVARPPVEALDRIGGGRMVGKTAIDPLWRYKALTEQFGPCGIGWKYEIVRLWTEPGSEGQVFAFAEINLYIGANRKSDATSNQLDYWSNPIPGVGGAMLIAKEYDKRSEKDVLYSSDEAYKMAITDALSVALKVLGFGAAIYMGQWDGDKYKSLPMTIDESKLADWLLAVDEAAEGSTLEDFEAWWPEIKPTIIKEGSEGLAARVYAHYLGPLKKKRQEEKAKAKAAE